MPREDDVLVDRAGKGADDKIRFELGRKVIDKKVIGVRFHGHEEYEPGQTGGTFTLYFEDGASLMVAVREPGELEIFVSMREVQKEGGRVQ